MLDLDGLSSKLVMDEVCGIWMQWMDSISHIISSQTSQWRWCICQIRMSENGCDDDDDGPASYIRVIMQVRHA